MKDWKELLPGYKRLPLGADRGESLCERLRNKLGPTVAMADILELGLPISDEFKRTFVDHVPHVKAISMLLDAPKVHDPTYYVSGHLDLTRNEFNAHYLPQLLQACGQPEARFVVGDARGADQMAMAFLASVGMAHRLSVYHMFDGPRNTVAGAALHGGFTTDLDRDCTMTEDSTRDIAWVRPGREKSGTAKNIARRG